MSADRLKVESFLYREARLMDENAYDEWLSLWTDDALYWVPCNRDDSDPTREISAIYDDRTRLQARIDRLKSGVAYAQDPKSRMRRLISNIEIERRRQRRADRQFKLYAGRAQALEAGPVRRAHDSSASARGRQLQNLSQEGAAG